MSSLICFLFVFGITAMPLDFEVTLPAALVIYFPIIFFTRATIFAAVNPSFSITT